MKKLFIVFIILFVLFTVSAKETGEELKVEEFNYRPYKASEFLLDSLALLGGTSLAAAMSLAVGFGSDSIEGFLFRTIGVASFFTPIMASAGVNLSGTLGYKSGGNFFAGAAGGYLISIPFLLLLLVPDGDLFISEAVLGTFFMSTGTMIGYAASRKTRLYSSGALIMNVLGTVLGGVSGLLTHLSTDSDSDIDAHSLVHAVPSLSLTIGCTFITFLISRYAIVDEPDNAGTWLGVMGGTILGAMTGFGIGAIWKYKDNGTYGSGATTALVIGGAIFGELIGFAASHTTMPSRKRSFKEKKITFNMLPPMMVPEKIPLSNKTLKRWMILNVGISF